MTSILENVRVIDLSRVFAGPFATQILADLGADIIKVEQPGTGDVSRTYGVGDSASSISASFAALNHGKRSIAIDLKADDGRAVARRLMDTADVVIENFRADVMDRLGLSYSTLSVENPGLIYCGISGFGRVGDLRNKAANDLIVQAYGGLLSITGEPDGPPVRCGTAIADLSAGLYAAVGILGALYQREITGLGQEIHTSLLESQMGMMGYLFADYWINGIVAGPMGTANRLGLPNQAFPTADGWVAIAATSEIMWERCCRGLGAPELATDPRFSSLPERYANREALIDAVSNLTKGRSTSECVRALENEGVSCAPINDVADVANDSQVKELGLAQDITLPDGTKSKVIGNPLRFSKATQPSNEEVPSMGRHSSEILQELGFDREERSRMLRERVVT